jgi:sortase (surface protein transpeptidase)
MLRVHASWNTRLPPWRISLCVFIVSCLLWCTSPAGARDTTAGADDASIGMPIRLAIPAIHVDAAIEQAGLSASGAMEEPSSPDLVAWYTLGPRPGEPGNAVIAGHVDWTTRLAVFWHLRDLRPGDTVRVAGDDGVTRTFIVTRTTAYPRDQVPLIDVFGPASGAHLNLITCAGEFDASSHQYEETLVVSADYASDEPAASA